MHCYIAFNAFNFVELFRRVRPWAVRSAAPAGSALSRSKYITYDYRCVNFTLNIQLCKQCSRHHYTCKCQWQQRNFSHPNAALFEDATSSYHNSDSFEDWRATIKVQTVFTMCHKLYPVNKSDPTGIMVPIPNRFIHLTRRSGDSFADASCLSAQHP